MARFTKALLLAKISMKRQRRKQPRHLILTLVMIRKRLLARVCYTAMFAVAVS